MLTRLLAENECRGSLTNKYLFVLVSGDSAKMYNPIDFEAGREWSDTKTKLFNIFFSGLRISFDWQDKNLDFLPSLKSLRRFTLESTHTIDISSLDQCVNLTSIVIECKIPKKMRQVELSHLGNLKLYLGPDSVQLKSLYQNDNIKRIHIHKYESPDLSGWGTANLEHLTIDDSPNLVDLNGIQNLKNLKLVEINNCANFKRPTLYKNHYPYLKVYINGILQNDIEQ